MSSASEVESTVFLVALLVILIGRRTYLQLRGARYSAARLFGFSGFALLLFAAFAASTIFAALGTWGSAAWFLLVPYGLVAVAAASWTEPHVRQVVQFETHAPGLTTYQLPWGVPVLYFVLFTSRIGLEIAVFGLSSLGSPDFPSSLPPLVLATAIGFDLLYGVSVGLLFGRSFGVRRAFQERGGAAAARPSPSETPPLP